MPHNLWVQYFLAYQRGSRFLIKHEFYLVELILSSIWLILVNLVIAYRVCEIIDIKLSFLPGKKSNSRISELDPDRYWFWSQTHQGSRMANWTERL